MSMEADELRKLLRDAGYEVDNNPADEQAVLTPAAMDALGNELAADDVEALRASKTSNKKLTGEDTPQTNAGIYFRDISAVSLLTAEQEVELAQSIERGEDARRFMEKPDHLTDEQLDNLDREVRAGDEARRQLTEANLRLVVSVARKYLSRGMPMLDLIQEGNIGLARAVEKYEWRKGFRFSTYAYWWIRQGITRAIADQARTIRVPVHMVGAIGDIYKVWRDLQQELGREPQMAEIAEKMGSTVLKVREVLQASRQPVSLETPLGEDGGSTLGDLIADVRVGSPHDAAAQAMLRRHMDDAMQILSSREREVLKLRYGLEDGRDHTLSEIAERLGVSSERIRQIEAGALNKLRQPKLRHKLREYLDEYVA
jgi:RNA polymerase primary sigma factor